MILLFIYAFVVGLSGAMMPGSLLTYTIHKSLSTGPKAGFVIVLGHAILELILVILIFLGFDVVLQSQTVQILIGVVGGILLAYMGIGMIYNSAKDKLTINTDVEQNGSGGMVLSSIILSATNPYFLLWWAIVGLGFILQAYQTFGYIGVVIYYLGHISADASWYGLISIVVGKTRKFISHKPYRVIIACLGCLLVYFGINFVYGAVMKQL